jgi:hypothetical protein
MRCSPSSRGSATGRIARRGMPPGAPATRTSTTPTATWSRSTTRRLEIEDAPGRGGAWRSGAGGGVVAAGAQAHIAGSTCLLLGKPGQQGPAHRPLALHGQLDHLPYHRDRPESGHQIVEAVHGAQEIRRDRVCQDGLAGAGRSAHQHKSLHSKIITCYPAPVGQFGRVSAYGAQDRSTSRVSNKTMDIATTSRLAGAIT